MHGVPYLTDRRAWMQWSLNKLCNQSLPYAGFARVSDADDYSAKYFACYFSAAYVKQQSAYFPPR